MESSVRSRHVPFDVVVAAASFGGVTALSELVARLPAAFPVPVLVVQHRAAAPDVLADILRWRGTLPVRAMTAAADEPLGAGVHVTAPRTRYTCAGGRWSAAGETVAPADDLMAAAAEAFGARTCAVALTGRLSDGARGVRAVKRAGGRVLVQSPSDARAPDMPRAAVATGCADLVVPLRVLPAALVALTMAPGAIDMFPRAPRPWADLSSA